jgi:hypothetical protein
VTSRRQQARRAPRQATLPTPVAVVTFIEALVNYWDENAKANKAKNIRLIEILAATFPQVPFLRLAATDPITQKLLDDLTAPQFAEIIGAYLSALLPTLSVEQINSFAGKVFEGIAPEHLRRLLPHAARAVGTALIFVNLLPTVVTAHSERKPVRVQIGSAVLLLDSTNLNRYRARLLQLAHLSSAEAEALGSDQFSMRMTQAMVAGSGDPQWQQVLEEAREMVGKKGLQGIASDTKAHLAQLFRPKPASPQAPGSRTLQRPEPEDKERPMLESDRVFERDGVRYMPLSMAAPLAQAPPSTLLHWIKKQTKFEGRPLSSYHFAPANQYFLSEESVKRAADRFIDWRSQQPAGAVKIGHTDDQRGYIRLQEAADTIGVDHHTMWRWATKGTTPTESPLDVIKCPATDQFYIRESDVSELKKLVPRSGLRAGRRHHVTPRPS